MSEFDHTQHKLVAVDGTGAHLHVSVEDLARETAEATAGVVERIVVRTDSAELQDLQRQIDALRAVQAAIFDALKTVGRAA